MNEPWIHPKTDGHILFTQTDLGEGVLAVQGWLILQTGPFEFLVVNTLTTRADFLEIRSTLEESFHTIEFDDLQHIAAKRVERLRSGNELLQAMTPEKMKALCGGEPRLFRVWQAVDGGQENEIGYYRVTVLAGTLSDASGEKPPKPVKIQRVCSFSFKVERSSMLPRGDFQIWMLASGPRGIMKAKHGPVGSQNAAAN